MKSIIQEKKECFFCGSTQLLHEHHVFEGRNRQNSEKYGLKVYLCVGHHTGSEGVHFDPIKDKLLKIIGQMYFEQKWGSSEDFIKVFRKNYKEDERDNFTEKISISRNK